MQDAIEHNPMPLIVVRARPILPDVEIVHWRAEEELTDIGHRLRDKSERPSCREPIEQGN